MTNSTIHGEQLVKATIGELKHNIVKTKLIKISSDTSYVPTSELSNLKPEPTFHAQNYPVNLSPIYDWDNGEDFECQNQEFPKEAQCYRDYYNDTFFNRTREVKSVISSLMVNDFPARVWLLAMCRGELSTVIARLISKCL